MLLSDIRSYLQQRGTASLKDVAVHFDIAPDTAQFALNYWQNKGKIREQAASCGSGSCGGCSSNSSSAAIYTWVKKEVPIRWMPNWQKSS
ncbi:MAG TPA: FeoC-like transcriptional regulator [Thiolinea sp.]|nr:FeoC-like transcriptional regulator [Thiolinea sp.]